MDDEQPLQNSNGPTISGYKQRQCGCLWILYLIAGIESDISDKRTQLRQTIQINAI